MSSMIVAVINISVGLLLIIAGMTHTVTLLGTSQSAPMAVLGALAATVGGLDLKRALHRRRP